MGNITNYSYAKEFQMKTSFLILSLTLMMSGKSLAMKNYAVLKNHPRLKQQALLYCKYCTDHEPFKTELGLSKHEKNEHTQKYKCLACRYGFQTPQLLREHAQSCELLKLGEAMQAFAEQIYKKPKEISQ